jgi:hypothetical protein
MTDWTYTNTQLAHFGQGFVIVPDQVADEQLQYDADRTIFPAYRCTISGTKLSNHAVQVRLDGEAYGLHTSGTGNMRVRRGSHPNR